MVLIHGYTDNSRSWSLLAPELADRHIYAVDLRGHGESAAPECCYTLMDFSHDLERFMVAQEIETADIVGHSLGSMTAALFAAQHPDMVDRLVLISTAATTPEAAGDWLWENVPQLPETLDPDSQFMKDWYWKRHRDTRYVADCPPGLAKKNPPCVPPGQARKGNYPVIGDILRVGDYRIIRDPRRHDLEYRRGWDYYRDDNHIYRVESSTRKILAVLNLVDAFTN
ncbi:alpha/beta hydrolase [Paracoccus sp. (in: a-proteobacteria)]|uniref:alpha/beta fold hydrolase n=1 Tax=Paracoccus sp. TaxID=267 RepID=UPI002AFFABD8|nr:alpha/beta hydrolase [Paracoccus sp. (in: a-proteobacteria)]